MGNYKIRKMFSFCKNIWDSLWERVINAYLHIPCMCLSYLPPHLLLVRRAQPTQLAPGFGNGCIPNPSGPDIYRCLHGDGHTS